MNDFFIPLRLHKPLNSRIRHGRNLPKEGPPIKKRFTKLLKKPTPPFPRPKTHSVGPCENFEPKAEMPRIPAFRWRVLGAACSSLARPSSPACPGCKGLGFRGLGRRLFEGLGSFVQLWCCWCSTLSFFVVSLACAFRAEGFRASRCRAEDSKACRASFGFRSCSGLQKSGLTGSALQFLFPVVVFCARRGGRGAGERAPTFEAGGWGLGSAQA